MTNKLDELATGVIMRDIKDFPDMIRKEIKVLPLVIIWIIKNFSELIHDIQSDKKRNKWIKH